MKQQSVRKAAVFLMSLGPDVAGRVMAKLPESMVEELTHSIASIGHVTYAEKKKVLSDFIVMSSQISGIGFGGEETAKQILEAGFGTHKATSMQIGRASCRERVSFLV